MDSTLITFISVIAISIVNLIGASLYFFSKTKSKINSLFAELPNSVEELVAVRNEELKANRKGGQNTSWRLVAASIKLGDALLDESEDLHGLVSTQRFINFRSAYRGQQSIFLTFGHSGAVSKLVHAAIILVFLLTIWLAVVAAIVFAVASQYESQLGRILAERKRVANKSAA